MKGLKDIPRWEGRYAINKDGMVWSYHSHKFMSPYFDKNKYMMIDLRCKKYREKSKVHRLVMQTYVGQSDLQVNHKDGNKANNNLSNLEYCTCSENHLHAYRVLGKKISEKQKEQTRVRNKKLFSKTIMQLTKEGILCKVYESGREASRATGINQSSIAGCANHAPYYSVAGGYKWEYLSNFPNLKKYGMV